MENVVKKILEIENISYQNITKSVSGFTNLVYFVDEDFVVKISKDEDTKKKLEKEILIYKNIQLDFMPRFIGCGDIDGYKYLIISKIRGNCLYSIWHKLGKKQRQDCVKQIAGILKVFHGQDPSFLIGQIKNLNWSQFMVEEFVQKIKTLKEMGYDVSYLTRYALEDLPDILSHNDYGLVHNDAHFDNFIYQDGKLFIIDFDRVVYCAIDYEMLIFKSMCDNPIKFANEDDEFNIDKRDYEGVFEQFRREYPEMFNNSCIGRRIEFYQFNYNLGHALKCNDNEWIKTLLKNFYK